VRIPLDYYRILGLPIQATAEQLRQAHRDRTLQLPRREYSDAAIAARKQLLDQAYTVLANPDQRRSYDSGFLAKTYDLGQDNPTPNHQADAPTNGETLVDPHTPSIEIEEDQFIGALLILQELGEYELVLKLGRPFLTGGSASLQDHHYGDPAIVFSDIVLTVALACLELGREQWQQGQYENAAEALETGQQLLLREGLFLNIRGEIQSDLYRLRPYRILELLSAPEDFVSDRRTGMQLLQEMLQERGGIDGNQDDHSGLTVDDFLKFIQQLRGYLTAEEQQYLFEQEAARPSAVATYLAVYALLARGFAERQPELIRQSKQFLAILNNRQDVHLEEAICSLLLGQPEAASQALEQSREQESISFIRQHSHSSPDLLPGLCLYTERWFHDEVFPHFRDLAHCRISLKEYFADRQVQHYLEALPGDVEELTPVLSSYRGVRDSRSSRPVAAVAAVPATEREDFEYATAAPRPTMNQAGTIDHDSLIAAARARIASRSNIATLGEDGRFAGNVSTAERIVPEAEQPAAPPAQPRSLWSRSRNAPPQNGDSSDTMPPRKMGDRPVKTRSARLPGHLPRWVLPLGGLLGVVLLGTLVAWLFHTLRPSNQTASSNEPLLVQLDKPLITLVDETTDPTTVSTIDKETAKQLIDTWLTAKGKAMGSTYEVAKLDQILADPKLTEWRNAADEAKRDGWYRTYKHDITIESVELSSSATGQVISTQAGAIASPASSPTATPGNLAGQPSPATPIVEGSPTPSPDATASPSLSPGSSPAPTATVSPDITASPSPSPGAATADQAKIVANVSESTETYRNGKASGSPQTEQLRVQYNLIRKDGKWRIQDWQIL